MYLLRKIKKNALKSKHYKAEFPDFLKSQDFLVFFYFVQQSASLELSKVIIWWLNSYFVYSDWDTVGYSDLRLAFTSSTIVSCLLCIFYIIYLKKSG